MNDRFTVALEAASLAGQIIKQNFRKNFTISTKRNDRDLVTSADFASEKAIVDLIRKHFPNDYILSEETEKCDINQERLWIIDPIDGTSNFVSGLPLCCVSIAYVAHGKIEFGVIYNPIFDDLFTAQKGRGAYRNKKHALKASAKPTLRKSLVSFDYSSVDEYRHEIQDVVSSLPFSVRGLRILGTSALEFAWVGAGFLDAYLSRGAHSWDVAAGILIVEESGGKVTDWQGNPWTFECGNFLVTNGKIHKQFIQITNRITIP